MRHTNINIISIDWISVMLYCVLVLLGLLSIYATINNPESQFTFDFSNRYTKQIIFIISSLILAFIIMALDEDFFEKNSLIIYFVVLAFLVFVAVFGREIAGAQAWVKVGGFSLQPSEFAKFSTALLLAKFLSVPNIKFNRLNVKLFAFLIIGLPLLIILFQNDAGTGLVFLSLVLVLYRKGLSGNIILLGFLFGILFLLTLIFGKTYIFIPIGLIGIISVWLLRKNKVDVLKMFTIISVLLLFVQCVDVIYNKVLEPHQQTRIDVLLGKKVDIKGVGYNTHQSKIAIGSGGFIGKGYLQGTQTKFHFVPEQSTDFIFCTIGEEWGFLGSLIVLGLYVCLLFRIIFLAERQRSEFSKLYGYGVASILFFHFTVNIAMTIGLAPVIGIPLPFFSYGGSSLWGFTILLFIFLKLDSNRLNVLR